MRSPDVTKTSNKSIGRAAITAALIAYWAALMAPTSRSWAEDAAAIPLQHVTMIRVGLGGEVVVRRTSRITWDIEFPEKQVLESQFGKEELELSAEQQSFLTKALTKYDELRDSAVTEYSNRHFPGIEVKLYQRLLSAKTEVLKQIRDELLPFQGRRLEEIVIRWKIRKEGPCHVLFGEWADDLAITQQQRHAIFTEAVVHAEWLEGQMKGRRRAVLDELFKELHPWQREKLEQEMGGFLYGASESLDLLCHQLSYRSPERPQKEIGDQALAGLRLPMTFVVSVDGTWKNYYRKPELDSLAISLLEVFENEGARTNLQFTDLQSELLGELKSDYETKRTRIRARYPASFFAKAPEGSVTHKAAIEWMVAQEKELRRRLAADLLSVLTPAQKASLDRLSRQCMALRRGYVAEFLDGELGKRLKLTSSQKAGIVKRASRLRRALVDALAQWEEGAYDAVFGPLNRQQRERVKKKIGVPLRGTVAPVSILLDDLSKPTTALGRRR